MYILNAVAHTDVRCGQCGDAAVAHIKPESDQVRLPSWITSISAFVFFVFFVFFGLEQVLTRVTSLYELAHAFPKLSESPSSSHKAVVYFGNRRYNARAPPIQHNCSSRECV